MTKTQEEGPIYAYAPNETGLIDAGLLIY